MGTRWDLREAAGCLMVYVEPDSRFPGMSRAVKLSVFFSLLLGG
ncbi:unnamed protein product [Staurois parvus]|uniref:Uncharacterized protein n=1 Tax=Staurois parvus TaxID=386267 RepID=A0ABN9BWR9_9NEOB|nr:unnamed protein product [Staurois parvus]